MGAPGRIGAVRRLLLASLALTWAAPTAPALGSDLEGLARRFAPVLRQDTASDQDYITNFDFDGDWDGSNNWEHQPLFPMRAYVYWSGLETTTHAYLVYAWFHPRDYSRWQIYGRLFGRSGAHENDLEGALLVIDKTTEHVVVMETVWHGRLLKYAVDPSFRPRPGVETHGGLPFDGDRPILEIEANGHGVLAWSGDDFRGGDGVIYRLGPEAGVPEGHDVEEVSYRLLDIESTLWSRRFDVGEGSTYGDAARFGTETIGHRFEGHNFGAHVARPPWGWEDDLTEIPAGAFFFDPARMVQLHFDTPVRFAVDYHPNPFTPVSVAAQ